MSSTRPSSCLMQLTLHSTTNRPKAAHRLKRLATGQNVLQDTGGNEMTIIYSGRIQNTVHDLSRNYKFKLARKVSKVRKCRDTVVKSW